MNDPEDKDDKPATTERLARQRAIGTELKDVFGPVEDEPIPDALRELAAELDRKLAGQTPRTRLKLVGAPSESDKD